MGLIFTSCGTKKVVIRESAPEKKETTAIPNDAPKTNYEKIQLYIATYNATAIAEMEEYGIPASITLAQGILESSMGGGRLAKEANNHFGIKCHEEWKGKRIYHDDDEKGECFRVYKSASESFRDHSLFLYDRTRYAFLFDLKTHDYEGWAKGLKKAGYATDPKYPQKLISLIERFDLAQFDKNTFQPKKKKKWTLTTHVVQQGDTLYSLAKKYNIAVSRLIQENKIEDNTIFLGQKLTIPTPTQ